MTLTLDASVVSHGEHVLRFAPDPATETKTLAEHLYTFVQMGATGEPLKILVLQPALPYSDAMTKALTQSLQTAGTGFITEVITYENDAVDLRDLAKDVEKRTFDAVFIPDVPERASLVASFLAQQNIWARPPGQTSNTGTAKGDARRFVWLLGTSLWYQEDFTALRYLEHALFPVAYAPGAGGAQGEAFARDFQTIYERAPGLYDALGYDVMRWLRASLDGGATDRAALQKSLEQGDGFEGVLGALEFVQGNATPRFRMVQVEGKRPAFVEPTLPTIPGEIPGGAP